MNRPAAGAPATRRQILTRGLAGAVLVTAGCGSSHHRRKARPGQRAPESPEAELLNRSLDLEYQTIAAYTAGIPLLDGRARRGAQQLLDQELSHSGELAGLVKQAGGKPRRPRASYDLGHPQDTHGVLALLEDLERRQLATYLDALPRLSAGARRAAIGAVLGSDAQHLAILRGLLDLDPIPTPLPDGRV